MLALGNSPLLSSPTPLQAAKKSPESASAGYQPFGPASSHGLCPQSLLCLISFNRFFRELHPFARPVRLLTLLAPRQEPPGRLGFILHTVAGLHRPKLHHYYGLICHLTPHNSSLESPLEGRLLAPDRRSFSRRPSGKTVQGFPSYLWLPEHSRILNHVAGLSTNWASRYFARLPTYTAESGSLSLCAVLFLWLPSDPAVHTQRRPCHSNCLPRGPGGVRFFHSGAT